MSMPVPFKPVSFAFPILHATFSQSRDRTAVLEGIQMLDVILSVCF